MIRAGELYQGRRPGKERPGWVRSGLAKGAIRKSVFHPLQTSEQRLTRLGERPHSSDGEAGWNDHHGAIANPREAKLLLRIMKS